MLYGRRELLERLPAYRVRPAGAALPGKWETGTQNHEALAGLLGTFGYLEALGAAYGAAARPFGPPGAAARRDGGDPRARARPVAGHPRAAGGDPRAAPVRHRRPRTRRRARADLRVHPRGPAPRAVAQHLARRAISTWDGDFYAWELVRALGLADGGGLVRIGLVHYNTDAEVERVADALEELA